MGTLSFAIILSAIISTNSGKLIDPVPLTSTSAIMSSISAINKAQNA
jgi:hypothetical protein